MRHLVVPTDGSAATDPVVADAAGRVGPDGALALICVLPGSLVDRSLAPAERGRVRRRAENDATARLREQVQRLDLRCAVRIISLFGDDVEDTVLLATNLGVDAVVVGADSPLVDALAGTPVRTVVAGQADAPA